MANTFWRKLSDHPIIIILGLMATIITIYGFLTGNFTLAETKRMFQGTGTYTPTTIPSPTFLPPPVMFGQKGGISWSTYLYNPNTDQMLFWRITIGNLNGISYLHIAPFVPSGLATMNLPTPTETIPQPSPSENVVYIAQVSFDTAEYCFILHAEKAQLFVDGTEIANTGFDSQNLNNWPYYAYQQQMQAGAHEIKFKLFKPFSSVSRTEFAVLWEKAKQQNCSNVTLPSWP